MFQTFSRNFAAIQQKTSTDPADPSFVEGAPAGVAHTVIAGEHDHVADVRHWEDWHRSTATSMNVIAV